MQIRGDFGGNEVSDGGAFGGEFSDCGAGARCFEFDFLTLEIGVDRWLDAVSGEDDKIEELGESLRLGPRVDRVPLVGAEEPVELCGGELTGEVLGGHPGVGRPGALDFPAGYFRPRKVCGGEPQHR